MALLTVDRIKDLFYEKDGVLYNKISRGRARQDAPSGSVDKQGYICVRVQGKAYKAHRLVWVLYNNDWPTKDLDHLDGNPANNSISNLREVTNRQNALNRKIKAKGYTKIGSKYKAQIKVSGKLIYLGVFNTEEEASNAYIEARENYCGLV